MKQFVLGLLALFALVSNAAGQQTWFRTYSWLGFTQGQVVLERPDSTLLLLGVAGQQGGDLFAAEIQAGGPYISFKPFGWEGQETFSQASWNKDSMELWALGSTNSLGQGGYDALLVVFSPQGDTLRTQRFGGNAWDLGKAMVRDSAGNFWLGIQDYSSYDQSGSLRLILLDPNGTVLKDTSLHFAGQDMAVEDLLIDYRERLYATGTLFPGPEGEKDVWAMGWDTQADSLLFLSQSGVAGDEMVQTICPYRNAANQPYFLISGNLKDSQDRWKNFFWRIDTSGVDISRIDLGLSQAVERKNSHAFFLAAGASHAVLSNFYDVNFGSWNTVYDSISGLFPQLSKTFVRNGNQELAQVSLSLNGGYLLTGHTNDIGLGQVAAYIERLGPLGDGVNGFVMNNPNLSSQVLSAQIMPNPAKSGSQRTILGLEGLWEARWLGLDGKLLQQSKVQLKTEGSLVPEITTEHSSYLLLLSREDTLVRFLCIQTKE